MNGHQIVKATLVILATLLVVYILITNIHILVVLLIAIIIASALRPATTALTRFGMPYGFAITLVYALVGLGIAVVSVLVLPPIVRQFANYVENDGRLASRIIVTQNWIEAQVAQLSGQEVVLGDEAAIRQAMNDLVAQVRAAAPSTLASLGNTIGDSLLVFVMGVYWLTSRDYAITFLGNLFPSGQRERFIAILTEIETTLGNYVRGVLTIAAFVSIANFLILALFRVPNAATYAIIIGLTTMLPIVGGFVGAGTATLLALLISPLHGLIVFLAFIGVQQLEMHIVTPRVMARSVGIDPLLVILAVFIGFAMYGPTGAIIAVPMAGALAVLVKRYVVEPRQAELEYGVVDGGVLLEVDRYPVELQTSSPHQSGNPR